MRHIKIDRIIKSRRRTFSLEIEKDGSLIVRAPKRASEDDIRKIVHEKKTWILKKQKKAQEKLEEIRPKKIVTGEEFLYLGNRYKLFLIDSLDTPLFFNHNSFLLKREYRQIGKKIFIKWYCEQAHKTISERVAYYSSVSGLTYNKIRITGAQKRWGSCSAKNNLNFSYRLIMAPLTILDYIVVHELAHTKEKNHSKMYWNLVKALFPDYKSHERWLKERGHLLFI